MVDVSFLIDLCWSWCQSRAIRVSSSFIFFKQ